MALYIVTGPPAAGKSTYVREHAQPGDIRIDYDEIANTISGAEPDNHDHPQHIQTVTKTARTAAIKAALKYANQVDVWIIHATPSATILQEYREHGAEIITIDPGKDVVMQRVKEQRPEHLTKVAGMWYRNTITITSSAQRGAPRADLLIEAAHLPNPHDVPGLRPRDGKNTQVQDWLLGHDAVHAFIDEQMERIRTLKPRTITVTCKAGKHRSVAIAEFLAERLNDEGTPTTIEHRDLKKNSGPTPAHERGYGYRHREQKRRLLARHKDGTACQWCNKPMWKTPEDNFDGAPLEADHSKPIKHHGQQQLADRLLHRACNRQRKDNPALTRPEGMDKLDEPTTPNNKPITVVDWG